MRSQVSRHKTGGTSPKKSLEAGILPKILWKASCRSSLAVQTSWKLSESCGRLRRGYARTVSRQWSCLIASWWRRTLWTIRKQAGRSKGRSSFAELIAGFPKCNLTMWNLLLSDESNTDLWAHYKSPTKMSHPTNHNRDRSDYSAYNANTSTIPSGDKNKWRLQTWWSLLLVWTS